MDTEGSQENTSASEHEETQEKQQEQQEQQQKQDEDFVALDEEVTYNEPEEHT